MKQATKQHAFIVSALAPAPRLLPCLSSCPDILQRTVIWMCKRNKPFPYGCSDFATVIETVRLKPCWKYCLAAKAKPWGWISKCQDVWVMPKAE